ncbi:MAG: SDR family NAD(P)-dependent oxidoreductase [Bacteroidales bacterium]|nr:SDR family NAD(P)-dependent oxidoreductase [Bacteroidales bacterium]
MKNSNWTIDQVPDLSGKIMVVTGGNSGLGYESVKAFAMKGAEVILASRSTEKGEVAKSAILKDFPDGKIKVMQLDLSDLDSVRRLAGKFLDEYEKLDVLMNNAGIMMTPYFKTKDGLEGQFGVNHLGHFALTGLLLDVLLKTPGSRIVNVSSGAHKMGRMDFSDLQFENGRSYSPLKSYGQSKLANLLFTYELQRQLESAHKDSISLAAHPGTTMTNLGRHLEAKLLYKILFPLFKRMSQAQSQGALPQIRASVDPRAKGGEYYGPDGKLEMTGFPVLVQSNAASHNLSDAASLWEESEKLTGVKIDI